MGSESTPGPELFALAAKIVDSDSVIRTFGACDWEDLHDDGKVWIAAIVREARADLLAALEPFARLRMPAKCEGNAAIYSILHSQILAARTATGVPHAD